MATIPKSYNIKFRHFINYFNKTDVKQWIIAQERGKTGYEHYQIRFQSCEELEKIRKNSLFYNGSVDKAEHWSNYEKKDGKYITSEDTTEIRKIRFGKPRKYQEDILKALKEQNVREIHYWYDPYGNTGKSWLCNYLYETGKGYYVPPTIDTVKGLIQFVASGYRNEEIIVIDIPRSWKWSEQLYTAIESIKDGLIYDTRYNASTRNIRGVKILVLSNTEPKLNKLSKDRWIGLRYYDGQIWESRAFQT